jgi:hypothetical protein
MRSWRSIGAMLLDMASIDKWYLFPSDPAYGRPLNPDRVTYRHTDIAGDEPARSQ